MTIAKNTLSPNHGLEPQEVTLYRLLRLVSAPKYFIYMNNVTAKTLFADHAKWKALMGLKAKKYVDITWNEVGGAQILEILK